MNYLEMMENQHMIHLAVQRNDFNLRTHCWENWLPFYFAFDMCNYARYGSYYVESLKTIENDYPGLKALLSTRGLTTQAQERFPIRTALDQRGEQTINRDAKTAGMFQYIELQGKMGTLNLLKTFLFVLN